MFNKCTILKPTGVYTTNTTVMPKPHISEEYLRGFNAARDKAVGVVDDYCGCMATDSIIEAIQQMQPEGEVEGGTL